ncbi:hypothetical protein QAD02_023573 [Eretmocerus hayati]|uniref:Uncharacterized protein n=1 Tax=Eretmocerus hayati TaxID=131215 RepID=A0ACC2PWX0_9HYME|nr:hypothetical protein QAD02_023573 [Eretmocerus hayati]
MLRSSIFLFGVFNIIAAARVTHILANNSNFGVHRGDPADVGDYPYEVIFEFPTEPKITCTGAIVSDHHIVTTAQCTKFVAKLDGLARVGSNTKGNGGFEHKIDKVWFHEKWNDNLTNNIAIIKVFEPFQLDKIPKVITPLDQNEEIKSGTNGTISGWGFSESGIGQQFCKINVVTIDGDNCKRIWGAEFVEKVSLCTESYKEEENVLCAGNFGDTLVFGNGKDRHLAGLLSWLPSQHQPDEPVRTYTNIAMYHNWINKVIQY